MISVFFYSKAVASYFLLLLFGGFYYWEMDPRTVSLPFQGFVHVSVLQYIGMAKAYQPILLTNLSMFPLPDFPSKLLSRAYDQILPQIVSDIRSS